jgi:hypothetical protein
MLWFAVDKADRQAHYRAFALTPDDGRYPSPDAVRKVSPGAHHNI